MRKRVLNSVSAVGIAVACGAAVPMAQAADGPMDYNTWYVSVFGGLSLAEVHASFYLDQYEIRMKDGFTAGLAVGSYVSDGVRMETELSYARNANKETRYDATDDFDPISGDMAGLFLMRNIWKDMRMSDRFQPYVGGGIGVALLSGTGGDSIADYDFDNSLAFAAQLGAGARYAVSDRLALDLGYRFKAAMDAVHEDDPSGAFSFYSHSFQAGLTYAFGDNGMVMPTAQGDSGLYVSLFGGAAFPDTTSWEYAGSIYALNQKTGFTLGAAVGTQLAPGLRGEAELSYVRSNLSSVEFLSDSSDPASGAVDQTYLLMNIWKDFDLGMISPYIGGGIGFGLVSLDDGVADGGDMSRDTGVGIAGQFGFGARMAATDNLMIDMGYRYKSIVDAMLAGNPAGLSDNHELATHNHIVQVGATYHVGGNQMAAAPEMTDKYISVFGGLTQMNDSHFNYRFDNYVANFKSGFSVGVAVGGNINEKMRGEIELSYAGAKVDEITEDGDFVSDVGEVNGYYLLTNLWRDVEMGGFNPYFGGGVGMALMDVNINLAGGDPNIDTTFALAAQVGAGLRFDLTDNATVDMGYRMKAALSAFTSGTDFDYHTMSSYYTHVGQIGLSWKF